MKGEPMRNIDVCCRAPVHLCSGASGSASSGTSGGSGGVSALSARLNLTSAAVFRVLFAVRST